MQWPRNKFRRALDGARTGVSLAPPPPPTGASHRLKHSSAPLPQQLYLDFGQRNVDSTRCAQCGMVWAPGVHDEERAHARFCAATTSDVVTVPRRRDERVVAWLDARGAIIQSSGGTSAGGCDAAATPVDAQSRVIAVTYAAGARPMPQVDGLLSRMLGEDSAPERRRECSDVTAGQELAASGAADSVASEPPVAAASAVITRWLLVAADGRLCAALVTESPVMAYAVDTDVEAPQPWPVDATAQGSCSSPLQDVGGLPGDTPAPPQAAAARGSDATSASSSGGASLRAKLRVDTRVGRRRMQLGVAQVWSRRDVRRRGYASTLLDVARAHAVYAFHVPLSSIAFSAPTEAGSCFARAYLQRGTAASDAVAAPPLMVYW